MTEAHSLKQSCLRDSVWSCWHLGNLYSEGKGIGRINSSIEKASDYYAHGCELNDPDCCYLAGSSYLSSAESTNENMQEIVHAVSAFQVGCSLDDKDSCDELEELTTGKSRVDLHYRGYCKQGFTKICTEYKALRKKIIETTQPDKIAEKKEPPVFNYQPPKIEL